MHQVSLPTSTGRFELLRAGAGERLVLVLHGFPDHPPSAEGLVAELAAAGYAVAAPWMRGYAPSPVEGPYHAEQLAADVLALADALGHRRFAVVGHDWGAVVACALAALAPGRVRAAVTMAVPHPLAFARALASPGQLARSWYMLAFQLPGAEAAAAAGDFRLVDWLWRRWSPGLRLPREARDALHACLAASWPAPLGYYRAAVRPPGEALRRVRAGSPLAAPLTVPTLHLHGADDGCIAPSAARGQRRWFAGPFAEEVLDGVGHFLHVEDPRRVAARVVGWLAAHGDDPAAAAAA